MEIAELAAAIDAEYDRLGLDKLKSPNPMLAGTLEGLEGYLENLRALPVGATWRDVYPETPAHWDLDDDETWTHPYSTDESNWGVIVLRVGATQDERYGLVEWVSQQPGVHHSRPDRHEDDVYYKRDA